MLLSPGLVLLSPGLAVLLFGLTQTGGGKRVDAMAIVPLAIGVILLLGFVVHALRTRVTPIIDLRLFRSRAFSMSSGLLFLSGLSLYSGTLLVPLYFQQALGLSAFESGLLLVPQEVGVLLIRGQIGKFTDRIGARVIVLAGIVGTVLATLGFTLAGTETSKILLGVYLLLFGAGVSAVSIAVLAAAYQGLRPEQIPHASGATRILIQTGGSFGTAVIALILAQQVSALGAKNSEILATAFNNTFWWALGFAVLAFVPALLLPGRARPDDGAPDIGRPTAEASSN